VNVLRNSHTGFSVVELNWYVVDPFQVCGSCYIADLLTAGVCKNEKEKGNS
jgi:hypothetical protein